ncbi:MAG: hypothetical protein WAZ75_04490 [Candidatus Absconditicoccaceae bacterium]
MEKDNGKENEKFLNNTLLWIKAHPDRNVNFNNQLKPIRRDILDNLKLNMTEGHGKCIDSNYFKSYFWAYLERNKNIPNFDVFKNINIRLNDDSSINLVNYLKILNIIRSNIDLVITDIQGFKKTFFIDDSQPVYSVGEYSLNIDNQMTKYNSFLYNRFSQYNLAIKDGSYKLRNIMYCYVLKNKFKNADFFDLSGSESVIYQDGVSIKLNIFSQIIDILGIGASNYIAKKI